jgi:tripartite-type tricarboxylate transporter receptor subunit TctC
MSRRRGSSLARLASVAITATACLAAPARGEEPYPSRLITIVAPITAGTAIDILARLYADKLAKRFGQQVVVANRPGAGGLIGA